MKASFTVNEVVGLERVRVVDKRSVSYRVEGTEEVLVVSPSSVHKYRHCSCSLMRVLKRNRVESLDDVRKSVCQWRGNF